MLRVLSIAVIGFFLGVLVANADTRSLYTVTDIPVDESAESVIIAQQRAFDSARLIGARQMLEKLTLQVDRDAVGGIPVDMALAQGLAAAVDVQEEVRGGGRYRGVLSVVFDPRQVRAHLNGLGVPFVDQQAPFSLAIPVVGAGVDVVGEPLVSGDGTENFNPAAMWLGAWGARNDGALAHYATTEYEYEADARWADVQEDVLRFDARRAFIAELRGRPGAYWTQITIITPAGRQVIGATAPASDIGAAARSGSALLDREWKEQAVIRSTERTVAQASVFYTSLAEWNSLRGALSRSPLISSFRINAIARDGAQVSFAFAGDLRRLVVDLRQRGIALDNDPAGWVMTSAVTAAVPDLEFRGEATSTDPTRSSVVGQRQVGQP